MFIHTFLDLLFWRFTTTVYTNFIMLQREKQQKLNELDVVVVLRLHQIQYMLNSALPQDLSQCLVFNSPGLVRLQHRIKELEKEKAEQKRLYRYLNASPREVYDLFSRAAREPRVNSRGLQTRPYIFLCFCVLIYLLVSAMMSPSDKLGPLFNCICRRFDDQEMLLAVHFVGKSILQGALKQFGTVASI